MGIHFKSVDLDATELLEQAAGVGLEFHTDMDKVHFLEFCEKVYRLGAEFGFDAAYNALVLKSASTSKTVN